VSGQKLKNVLSFCFTGKKIPPPGHGKEGEKTAEKPDGKGKAQERLENKGTKKALEKQFTNPAGLGGTPPEKAGHSGPPGNVYMEDDEKFPPGNYFNVRAGRKRMRDRNEKVMGDDPEVKRRRECGFNIAGDDRVKGATMRYRLDSNITMSLSFNPATMMCDGCQERGRHSLIGKEPLVLVATDQNFPATMFSKDKKQCIAVMRLEFGTMKEIGFAVSDLLGGLDLAEGSIVLVGSVSDLDAQGVSGYSEELGRTIRILREKLGPHVKVTAAPPVLIGGVNSERLVRAIIEAESWLEGLEGGECAMLSGTRRVVMSKIDVFGVGVVTNPKEEVHLVPRGVNTKEKIRYTSVGWKNTPTLVKPLSEEAEAEVLASLVGELRTNFGARLSSNLVMDRNGNGGGRVWEYVMIGGSNSERLGDVLAKMGRKVTKVTSKGWRPTKQGVADVVGKLDGKMGKDAMVIFLGLDNGMFYEADEDGERSLPSKDKEGKYHVVGKVEVASGRQARALMENCEPIWEMVGDRRKAILSPIVRYFRCSCCEDRTHCQNVGRAGYGKGMLSDLGEIKDAMVDSCLAAGVKGFKVINPNELMGINSTMEEDEVARLIGEDPVHLLEGGYVVLAERLTNILEDGGTVFQGEKREREEDGGRRDEEEPKVWGRQKCDWITYAVSGSGRLAGGK